MSEMSQQLRYPEPDSQSINKERTDKNVPMITPELLISAGWKKMGNAWYYNGDQKHLTNFEGGWQLWRDGKSIAVTMMNEL